MKSRIDLTQDPAAVVSDAIAVLVESAEVYQRGGLLVRVRRVTTATESDKGVTRTRGTATIEPLSLADIRDVLSRHAEFFAGDRRKLCPPWVPELAAARGDWPAIPFLAGVSEVPVLRRDGAVHAARGYDESTGYLFAPGKRWPAIPIAPSAEDARSALAVLLEPFADFPFERPEHRSAALAGVLTLLARPAFNGCAPLVLIDATVQGSGKTLLAETIAGIGFGRSFPRMTASRNEDEERKRILAIALSGSAAVLVDNVTGTLGSGALAAALTATEWQDRVLGASSMVTAPLRVTWFASGNNCTVTTDLARRALHVRLRSPLERPDERTGFAIPHLEAWTLENQPRLAAAGLTILSAFLRAGSPGADTLTPWGSFDAWSRLVRGALVWVGEPDPALTRTVLRSQGDTATAALVAALELLADAGPKAFTAGELARRLWPATEAGQEPLRDALEELMGEGAVPSAKRLGKALARYRGRIAGGRYLDATEDAHKGSLRWRVQNA